MELENLAQTPFTSEAGTGGLNRQGAWSQGEKSEDRLREIFSVPEEPREGGVGGVLSGLGEGWHLG